MPPSSWRQGGRMDVPTTRVPSGSLFFPINTHALSSKRTTWPSRRCSSLAHRTTTACRMSPRFTLLAPIRPSPCERCFCTTTTISSPARGERTLSALVPRSGQCPRLQTSNVPIRAGRFIRAICAHSTTSAPELSMQLSSVWWLVLAVSFLLALESSDGDS